MSQIPSLLEVLQQQLITAKQRNDDMKSYNEQGQIIQISGLGKRISGAYEQLRNAAEYTEDHLLLQRAIRRYFHRTLAFSSSRPVGKIGEELIIELTQAGYLKNKTYGVHVAALIDQKANEYLQTYHALRSHHVSRDKAGDWILDLISVAVEEILNPHFELQALATFAYNHYLSSLPREAFHSLQGKNQPYELCLYVAVHKSLLKSDIAIVRHDIMAMYGQSPTQLESFIQYNRQVDALFTSKLTEKLERSITKYGAPLRVLKNVIDTTPNLVQLLESPQDFLAHYEKSTLKDFRDVGRRVNRGIVRSIIFIFITKIIIGMGVEVPYDLLVVGSIAIVPLVINLLVPPIYMAFLKLGLRKPSSANAKALRQYIEGVLYPSVTTSAPVLTVRSKGASTSAKILYGIFFFVPFAITIYILHLIHFNIVQTIIFFIFLSTASFFGFRLSSMIRELELISAERNILSILRDFFYLPFILVGQWLSRNYARVNVVAFMLDMAIELPLKSVLRLIRQWTRFLNEKHEEMY